MDASGFSTREATRLPVGKVNASYPGMCWRAGASRCEQKPFVDPKERKRLMSLQMRLVHARKGLTPPALHTEEAARDMAFHAPQPAPMPARMRGRFTATCDKGITRVFPKQGLRSGGALIYLHGGAYVYPMVAGQWGVVEGLIDRTGLPVIIPDYPLAPNHTAARPRRSSAASSSSATRRVAGWRSPSPCSDATRVRVRWTASSCTHRGWTSP